MTPTTRTVPVSVSQQYTVPYIYTVSVTLMTTIDDTDPIIVHGLSVSQRLDRTGGTPMHYSRIDCIKFRDLGAVHSISNIGVKADMTYVMHDLCYEYIHVHTSVRSGVAIYTVAQR